MRGGSTASPMDLGRNRQVRRILAVILGLNWAVAAAKLTYGSLTDTLSMVADGFHSVVDGSANVIGLVATTIAILPADHSHPYGHRKFESFAALGISLLLFIAAYHIGAGALTRWHTGGVPHVTAWSFLVMTMTIITNLAVSQYELYQGRQLQSEILQADALHTRSDLFASVSVVLSLAAARLGFPELDLFVSLFIILLILYAGFTIISESLQVLADASRLPSPQVEGAALEVEGVRECHAVRSRGPRDAVYMDLHILVDPTLSVAAAHEIAHGVEARLKHQFPEVTDLVVHVEPDTSEERRRPRTL